MAIQVADLSTTQKNVLNFYDYLLKRGMTTEQKEQYKEVLLAPKSVAQKIEQGQSGFNYAVTTIPKMTAATTSGLRADPVFPCAFSNICTKQQTQALTQKEIPVLSVDWWKTSGGVLLIAIVLILIVYFLRG